MEITTGSGSLVKREIIPETPTPSRGQGHPWVEDGGVSPLQGRGLGRGPGLRDPDLGDPDLGDPDPGDPAPGQTVRLVWRRPNSL